MKPIDIKGKSYIPVHERVMYFRSHADYEGWCIITEIVNMDSEIAVIKAIIKDSEGNIKATGHAFELQTDTKSFVNKTSYLENAETSAVGRALGMLGIGIENSFASADEVKNAQKQQSNQELDKPWLSDLNKKKFIDRIRGADYGDLNGPEECLEVLKKKYRIRKDYIQEIEEEINDPFNKQFIDEK